MRKAPGMKLAATEQPCQVSDVAESSKPISFSAALAAPVLTLRHCHASPRHFTAHRARDSRPEAAGSYDCVAKQVSACTHSKPLQSSCLTGCMPAPQPACEAALDGLSPFLTSTLLSCTGDASTAGLSLRFASPANTPKVAAAAAATAAHVSSTPRAVRACASDTAAQSPP